MYYMYLKQTHIHIYIFIHPLCLTCTQHDNRRDPGPQTLLQLRPYLPLLRQFVTKGKVEEIRERKVLDKEMVRISISKRGSRKTV